MHYRNLGKLHSGSLAAACIFSWAIPDATAQGTNFINEGKGTSGYMDPDKRFVIMNSGIANMAAQQFGLPKDAATYQLAGMTVFPYYQASAPLKEFLNNATVMGIPVTQFPTSPNLPQFSLPPTDLVNRSFSLPQAQFQKKQVGKISVNDKRMRDEVPWMVAHQGGQAFQIPGDNEALALVAPGTMFSACAARTMVLRCGLMWIFTGSRGAAVLTKDSAIAIKPYSIVAIEGSWFNQLRVANLYGQAVDMQLAYNEKTERVKVETGKELCITEIGSDAETKKQADETQTPVATVVPGLKLGVSSINAKTCRSLQELTAISPPFSNPRMSSDFSRMFTSFGISGAMRREAIQKQILEQHDLATKAAIGKLGKYPSLEEVAAEKSPARAFPQPQEELKSQRLANGRIRYLSNSEISLDERARPLMSLGEALFIADRPLVIRSSSFTVHMRAGSMVHMVARKDVILVRNLGEQEPDSVKIRLQDHIFDCGVGAELIAGSNAPAIFDEMQNDGLMRRNIQSTEAISGTVVVNKSELSLTSLMQHSPLMRKIYKSPSEQDKKLVSDLMKTIVAINMVTGSHGNYKRISGLSGVH